MAAMPAAVTATRMLVLIPLAPLPGPPPPPPLSVMQATLTLLSGKPGRVLKHCPDEKEVEGEQVPVQSLLLQATILPPPPAPDSHVPWKETPEMPGTVLQVPGVTFKGPPPSVFPLQSPLE